MSIMVDIEMTPEIASEIRQQFISRLDKKYDLIYTYYQDNLNSYAEAIQNSLKNNNADTIYEQLNEWISDSQYEGAKYQLDEIKNNILRDNDQQHLHPFIEEWFDADDNAFEIRCMIENRDVSMPTNDLIKNTSLRARVMLHINYDSLPNNYDMGNTYSYSEYVKHIIDVLYLNPALVKQEFLKQEVNTTGYFPNLRHRNGKEAVSYSDFVQELRNQCCYGLLTFAGKFPLQELFNNYFGKITHIVIPKDNCCGMFNDWNGSGSLMEMKLLRDLKVPVSWVRKTKHDSFDLIVDEPNVDGYCIDEVYGLVRSFWNKELTLTFAKKQTA